MLTPLATLRSLILRSPLEPWVEAMKRWLHPFDHIGFRLFSARIDREAASKEITAVILTFDPNPLFERCLASVKAQSVPPVAIEVVRNVSPVSLARQQGIGKVETPYYVQVDGDMVLSPACFERLYFAMSRNPRCGEAEASLEDPFLGVIKGVKMYRTGPVKSIGFHPVAGDKSEDRAMSRHLEAKGYRLVDTHSVEGLHHPAYTPLEAFWKFRSHGEKILFYQRSGDELMHLVRRIGRRWRASREISALYALAGLFDGLGSADPGQVLSYEGREDHPAFKRIDALLKTLEQDGRTLDMETVRRADGKKTPHE